MSYQATPRGASLSAVEVPESTISTVSLAVSKSASGGSRLVTGRDAAGATGGMVNRFSAPRSLWHKVKVPLVVKSGRDQYSRELREYEDYMPREPLRPVLQRRSSLSYDPYDKNYYNEDAYGNHSLNNWGSSVEESRDVQPVRNQQSRHNLVKTGAKPTQKKEEDRESPPIIIASGLVPKNLEPLTSEYKATHPVQNDDGGKGVGNSSHKRNESHRGTVDKDHHSTGNNGHSGTGNNGHSGTGNGHSGTGNNGHSGTGSNAYHSTSNSSHCTTGSDSYSTGNTNTGSYGSGGCSSYSNYPASNSYPMKTNYPASNSYPMKTNYPTNTSYPTGSSYPANINYPASTNYLTRPNYSASTYYLTNTNYPANTYYLTNANYPTSTNYPTNPNSSASTYYLTRTNYPASTNFSTSTRSRMGGVSASRSYLARERDQFHERYFEPASYGPVTAPLASSQQKYNISDVFDRPHGTRRPELTTVITRRTDVRPKPMLVHQVPLRDADIGRTTYKSPAPEPQWRHQQQQQQQAALNEVFSRMYQNAPSRKRGDEVSETAGLLEVPASVKNQQTADSAYKEPIKSSPGHTKDSALAPTARQEHSHTVVNMSLLAPDIVVDGLGKPTPVHRAQTEYEAHKAGGNDNLPSVLIQGVVKGQGTKSPHHQRSSFVSYHAPS
nr:putative uncharacterized protein DDB_G0289263 [Cherax quadricarinatus]